MSRTGRTAVRAGVTRRATMLSLLAAAAPAPARAHEGQIVARAAVRHGLGPRAELAASWRSMGLGGRRLFSGVRLERITYLSDGLRVRGYLAAPLGLARRPAIIWNRGGNREFGALNDLTAGLFLIPMAARGYVVVASQYRGNAGGEGREEFGGADVADVLNLLPLPDRLPGVDPGRIGMHGWSRGGLMTYLALARTTRIRAAVVGAGVANPLDWITREPEFEHAVLAPLIPRYAEERDAALLARSPVRWPERLCKSTPILLLHGSADPFVHPSQTLAMARALQDVRHPYRLAVYEGGGHGLRSFRGEVHRQSMRWFDRFVRDREPLPDLAPRGM